MHCLILYVFLVLTSLHMLLTDYDVSIFLFMKVSVWRVCDLWHDVLLYHMYLYTFGYYLTDELYSIEHGHGFGITDMGLSSDFSPRNSAHIARLWSVRIWFNRALPICNVIHICSFITLTSLYFDSPKFLPYVNPAIFHWFFKYHLL